MPWDPDADFQITEADMFYLAAYYNMTTYHHRPDALDEDIAQLGQHEQHRTVIWGTLVSLTDSMRLFRLFLLQSWKEKDRSSLRSPKIWAVLAWIGRFQILLIVPRTQPVELQAHRKGRKPF